MCNPIKEQCSQQNSCLAKYFSSMYTCLTLGILQVVLEDQKYHCFSNNGIALSLHINIVAEG
jgi:hypothetical protein